MTNDFDFQTDADVSSAWILFHRLQNLFQNANPVNPEATFEAVQHVLDERNVVDESVHPDSPRRNRPAYLNTVDKSRPATLSEPKADLPPKTWEAKPVTILGKDWNGKPSNPPPQKNWNAQPKTITLPPKDWGKNQR